jgi:hypothetical protein
MTCQLFVNFQGREYWPIPDDFAAEHYQHEHERSCKLRSMLPRMSNDKGVNMAGSAVDTVSVGDAHGSSNFVGASRTSLLLTMYGVGSFERI